MSSLVRLVAAVMVAAALLPAPALAAQAFAVTPAPAQLTPLAGALTLGAGDAVWIAPGDAEARGAAQWLVDTLAATRGVRLVIKEGAPPAMGGVVLTRGGPERGGLCAGRLAQARRDPRQGQGRPVLWRGVAVAAGGPGQARPRPKPRARPARRCASRPSASTTRRASPGAA
jgi:hexosaminidase